MCVAFTIYFCFTLAIGGVFGNQVDWIAQAMERAFILVAHHGLDVRIVSYGRPDGWLVELCERFNKKMRRDTKNE